MNNFYGDHNSVNSTIKESDTTILEANPPIKISLESLKMPIIMERLG